MDRYNNDRYEQDNNQHDYEGNAGYNQNDEHYHSARNLTDEFEQHYQRQTGNQQDNRNDHTPNQHNQYGPHNAYNWGNNRFRDEFHHRENRSTIGSDFRNNPNRNWQSNDQQDEQNYLRTNSPERNTSHNLNQLREDANRTNFEENSRQWGEYEATPPQRNTNHAQPYEDARYQRQNLNRDSNEAYRGNNRYEQENTYGFEDFSDNPRPASRPVDYSDETFQHRRYRRDDERERY